MFFNILSKELKQLLSDKGVLAIALIQPLVFIMVFGSSFQGGSGINDLDTIVIDEDLTNYSKYVVDAVYRSEAFEVVNYNNISIKDAIIKLNKSEVRAIVHVKKGFGKNIENAKTGNLSIYLDSSDFMTYNALKGSQIEIVGWTLENITSEILGDLEKKRDDGKEKVDEIKVIFDEIKRESDSLQADIDEIEEVSSDFDGEEITDLMNDLEDSLDDQITALQQTQNAIDSLIAQIQSIDTSEQQKVGQIIAQLSYMKSEFNNTRIRMENYSQQLDDIDLGDFDTAGFRELADKMDSIKESFERAQRISDSVDLDFDKLQESFLSEPIELEEKDLFGDIKYFDYLGAGVLSLVVFFIGLVAPSTNIIYEKEKNTLYRVSTTPISGFSIFLGKFTLFVLFGFFEALYSLGLAVFMYGLRISGNMLDVVVILFLLNCAAISLGLFISSKVKTLQQGLIIVPVIVIPLFLISQSFFPKDMFPDFMNYISLISPMTFSNHALRVIMIKGFELSDVMGDVFALLAFTFIPLILFVWSYRRIKY